ncbi:hypothetical protein K9B35_00185 [Sphingomonas sp. R647]|uniref:hypothetical protein n=1 Tax=Sphingomonas sp. R647 TaxID=2875233 RepID=UPI001CD6EF33|nr:hypothetical protein [Sphingomonas sp. R647]MCA1196372.1 hypothetical protein [Sphingomonas sp. R647]
MNDDVIQSISAHLKGLGIDNFSIDAGQIRIGSLHWIANACTCGETGCDGWALEPILPVGSRGDRPRS